MKFRQFALAAAMTAVLGSAHAGGSLIVDQADSDTYGSTDTFAGSISNGTGTLDGNWTFTLDTPTDGSKWSVLSFLIDFASPYANNVSASLNGVAGTVTHTDGTPFYQVDFSNLLDGGSQTLAIDGVGVGNGAVSLQATAVPEPESYAMLLAGLGALGFMSRRRVKGQL